MGDRVVGDEVIAALFVQEDPRRILSALVKTMGVAAYIPVQTIVHQLVATAAIETNPQSGIEGKKVVVHHALIAAGHQECVLTPGDLAVSYDCARAVFQVDRGAVTQPFVLLVVVVTEPVGKILMFTDGPKSGAIIVGKIAVFNRQAFYIFCGNRDLIAPGPGVFQGDVFAFDQDGRAYELVGQNAFRRAAHFSILEIYDQVFTGDGDASHFFTSWADGIITGQNFAGFADNQVVGEADLGGLSE